ncbi:hypothetical protein N7471_007582 [Penicillium samsonianum]|uniref:uncharacterized protein n=1 Tax=Penicillium samsonianum TaxID=1882272 RepID=UPI0025495A79|nr:uncharacterized protein N7471_007582 [Penicillium samsonianum]KAJ6132367.1 hypothetical protein N7471_007582 [Penicillium samsonianum]
MTCSSRSQLDASAGRYNQPRRHKRLVSGVSGATPLSLKLREHGGTFISILFNRFCAQYVLTFRTLFSCGPGYAADKPVPPFQFTPLPQTPTRTLHELNNPNQSQILKATRP